MEKWIEIKSIPKIKFAHTYVSLDNYKNFLPAQNNFFEISYLRYEDAPENLTENKFKRELADGLIKFHVRPRDVNVYYDGKFVTHCIGVACEFERTFDENDIDVYFGSDNAERLKEIIDEIIWLYNFDGKRENKINSLIFEFIDLFFAQHEKDVQLGKEVTGEIGYVNKVKEYVKRFISRKITVKQLAKHIHVSEAYLCTVFKKIAGESIVTYINKYRLYLIKNYVSDLKMTLKEACALVGIKDPAYASRLFKKYERQSLREFKSTIWVNPRKQGKGKNGRT